LADDYLVKPFSLKNYCCVSILIEKKAPSETTDQDIIRIDDLIVNKTEQKSIVAEMKSALP
jgi:DNA-binding response OmpR family regulator